MISYNSLGINGRLGNQMFQYAALKGLARARGYDFCIPFSSGIDIWRDHQLIKYFILDKNIQYGITNFYTVEERKFNFDSILLDTLPDNVNINGYFQSEKYFMHIKDEIVSDFTFKKTYTLPFKEYNSVHVRRTDYLQQPQYHPVCSREYYEDAISIIENDLPLVVISDDPRWSKENIRADYYTDGSAPIHDLFIMVNSTNNIIANSSFSWWGAWLNNNPEKKIVCPKNWFGTAYSHYNMSDLRPTEWIQI